MGLFLPVKAFVISSAMLVIFLAVIHPAARADSQSRYDECKEQARKLSRYTGPVPAERKRSGGVLRGAVAGATAGAALGWITDSDRGDAAKKGAALGALIGAVTFDSIPEPGSAIFLMGASAALLCLRRKRPRGAA